MDGIKFSFLSPLMLYIKYEESIGTEKKLIN